MRLMLVDYGIPGGIDAVNRAILPYLPKFCDRVLYVAPAHWIENEKIAQGIPNVDVECLHWTSGPWAKVSGLLRRIPESSLTGLRREIISRRLRHLCRKHSIDGALFTWIFDTPPPTLRVPMACMIMDLNWQVFPKSFPKPTSHYDAIFTEWLRLCRVVFPISEFTKANVERSFTTIRPRSVVVPHGSNRVCLPQPESVSPNFYFPASVFAHKGHLDLLRASLALYRRGREFDLVFSGGRTDQLLAKEPATDPAVKECQDFLAQNREFEGRVLALGYVEQAQVEQRYANASAVVLPTHYEGFGLPLIEAFERGKPVIATRIPPFLEQIECYGMEGAVKLVDPGSPEQLEAAMEEALDGKMAGIDEANLEAKLGRWTWEDVAETYVKELFAGASK
ncbi:MAG TPA: glycosyltransferase [Fimbriimonadaceae bacterium]|nr:glycosyltransferase [Fimbriimonadaceae bacterium]